MSVLTISEQNVRYIRSILRVLMYLIISNQTLDWIQNNHHGVQEIIQNRSGHRDIATDNLGCAGVGIK